MVCVRERSAWFSVLIFVATSTRFVRNPSGDSCGRVSFAVSRSPYKCTYSDKWSIGPCSNRSELGRDTGSREVPFKTH